MAQNLELLNEIVDRMQQEEYKLDQAVRNNYPSDVYSYSAEYEKASNKVDFFTLSAQIDQYCE